VVHHFQNLVFKGKIFFVLALLAKVSDNEGSVSISKIF